MPPAPPRWAADKHVWDLEARDVFSPRWGMWVDDKYTIAGGVLQSQALALVRAAAPKARLVSDTLTGADTPLTGGLHLWVVFDVAEATRATLSVMYRTAPQRVYLDGFVITGSACTYDTPAGGATCTDGTPCAVVPISLEAGSHSLELRFDTPGAIAAAALTTPSGLVLAQTDSQWYATFDATASSQAPGASAALSAAVGAMLPQAPPVPFRLEHPTLGTPLSLDPYSWSPCGSAGVLRLTGQVHTQWGRASPPPDPLPRALRAKMNLIRTSLARSALGWGLGEGLSSPIGYVPVMGRTSPSQTLPGALRAKMNLICTYTSARRATFL